ncbi:hypothetical protein [Brytella acorum]|uniref:Uncharacterized protein n=1 Tax=Brytella acorum TaxID=2959299 RepID=A0AA35Y311_9PROT|nr:hypothetical protein [Brytella acorum]MDF3626034.1 hypothetical protein [Brytella acorum]CAI9122138.1 hypothetical protein LMG32879_002995 [Brytella acorum]
MTTPRFAPELDASVRRAVRRAVAPTFWRASAHRFGGNPCPPERGAAAGRAAAVVAVHLLGRVRPRVREARGVPVPPVGWVAGVARPSSGRAGSPAGGISYPVPGV